MATDNSSADRVEEVFYSRSDEKFTLRALLDEILGDRKFNKALDVGPGAGHISETLARRTRELTMVELSPRYQDILRSQFENARIITASIAEVPLKSEFELILFSHNLYYHPEDQWLSLCRRLFDLLVPGGELIIIMNSDQGDWWKIVGSYWEKLRESISFHYIPLSQFKKELSCLAPLKVHPYRFHLWIEPGETWIKFVGRQILELSDESVLLDNEQNFLAMDKSFRHVDGKIELDFRAEIIRLKREAVKA